MINISYENQVMHCAFEGHLGADHSAELSTAIKNKIDEIKSSPESPERIKTVFDLEKVDFIASSFIRICISTFKDVGHENFSIINTKPIIKKTFAIAGLSEDMNIT